MGFRLYKTKLKCFFRDRENMWAILFPLFLAIIFNLAFSNLNKQDSFETVNIAAVSVGSASEESLLKALTETNYEQGNRIFNVTLCGMEEAKDLLDNNKITAYVIMKETPELVVKGSDLQTTVARSVLNNYIQIKKTVAVIRDKNVGIERDTKKISDDISNRKYFLNNISDKDKELDSTLIYFYALLGLTCIYASSWGLREGLDMNPNESSKGARIQITPYSKAKLLFCNLAAGLTIQMIGTLIALVFMIKILNINFGTHLHLVIFTCVIGTTIGVLLGCIVAMAFRGEAKSKDAILTVITLIAAVLAGLIIPDMKYTVATHYPILSYINPVSLITDCFYSLYYYSDLTRFYHNIGYLGITAIIYTILVVLGLRRKNYASI